MTLEVLTLIAALCNGNITNATCIEQMVDCTNKQILVQLRDKPKEPLSEATAVAICVKRGNLR